MTSPDYFAAPGVQRPWRHAAVALILAMHGLGLYCLLMPPKQLKQATEVAFMMLVPPRPLPRTPPMPLPMPMPTPKSASPPRASIGPAPALLPSAPLPVPAITAPAEGQLADEPPPEAPSGDLRTRARLVAGAADKALRAELKQEKPWLTITQPQPQRQTRFEQLMAAAYQGGPMIRMEEYQTPDGRAATRVVTATGSRCYAMPANPGSGADPFNTGGKLKQVPC